MMHQSVREESRTPEQHLEQEWQLFQHIEEGATSNLCRTWEATRPVVVVGRNTPLASQVVMEACGEDEVPVIRRFTGGGAVVLGPGCLNYALGLSLVVHPDLTDVTESFRVILGRIAAALPVAGLTTHGATDLALNGRKVSGNAQRRGRRALLHHGTLLYAFDARLAARYLKEPERQPTYRASRRHAEFMGNLPLSRKALEARLKTALEWQPLTGF
ncbi:MAG: lipoate--protein ligase family protein [Blastocatellia bacterium]|nr:MAG: lipoate--protein ligase family protein [Blastocatellia bacterium]